MTRDGEDAAETGPGDTAHFPIDRTGTWTIHENLRKVFVVYLA